MTKRKGLFISLISLLVLCLLMCVLPLFNFGKTETAKAVTTYDLKAKNANASLYDIYMSRWTASTQGQRGYNETSGKWYFGYGDIYNSTSNHNGSFSFTEAPYIDERGNWGLGGSEALNLYYGQRITTKLYNSRKQRSIFYWEAEDYGSVYFTGLFAKANSDMGTLAKTQNDLAEPLDLTGVDVSSDAGVGWNTGDSYTIAMWKVTNYGAVTQYIPFEIQYHDDPSTSEVNNRETYSYVTTFTNEYAYTIPQREFTVHAGDKIVFTLTCNSGDDWGTGTVALLDSTFTKKVDQTALDKATIESSQKKASFYAISDTHMTGADSKYLPTIVADMASIDKDASAIFHLGDMTDIGVSTTGGDQLTPYYAQVAANPLKNTAGETVPWLQVVGNHDVRGNISDGVVTSYYDMGIQKYMELEGVSTRNWVKTVAGYEIIGLNTFEYQWDNTMLSAEDIVWLDQTLTASENSGKARFVLIHASDDLGQVYVKSGPSFRETIEKHSNVIVMSGHTHDGFGTATISKTASGSYFINQPSLNHNIALSTSWDANLGLDWSHAGNSPLLQYYYIEVYEAGVILRARDLTSNVWCTDADVAILTAPAKATVTFNNYDGSEISSTEYNIGETPVAPSQTPTKPADTMWTYTFAGWDKEITAVTADVTYTATYNAIPIMYNVTISNDASQGGINGISAQQYQSGSTINNVTITANENYKIASVTWAGQGVTVSNNKTLVIPSLTVNADSALVVVYEGVDFTVSVLNDTTKGIVTGVQNNQSVQANSQLNISVTAKTGYDIESVTINGVPQTISNVNNFSVNHTATADVVLVVDYVIEKYLATVICDNGATVIGVTNNSEHDYGSSFMVGASAKDGYTIKSVKVNGVSVTITNNKAITFNVTVEGAVSIVIESQAITYKLTISNATAQGTIAGVTNNGEYQANSELEITVTAKTGYKIKSIKFGSKDVTVVSNSTTVTFKEKITADTQLSVIYESIGTTSNNNDEVTDGNNGNTNNGANNDKNESSGCGASMEISCVGLVAVALAGVCLMFKKSKKD